MADFRKAILKVLRHEGVALDEGGNPISGRTGLVNHPDDPGGETNYGITRETATRHGYTGPMRDIPFETVLNIYKAGYWDLILADEIPDQAIAEELFDTGVNLGMSKVIEFLQRTLNAHNKKGTLYADIPVDGRAGATTIGTLKAALLVEPWYRDNILKALDGFQRVHYLLLAEKNPRFETFVPGWLRNRTGP